MILVFEMSGQMIYLSDELLFEKLLLKFVEDTCVCEF